MTDSEIDPQRFREFCGQHQLCCGPEQAELIRRYLELLLKWNRKINLTARNHWQSALLELIADSFHLNQFIRTLFPAAPPAVPGRAPDDAPALSAHSVAQPPRACSRRSAAGKTSRPAASAEKPTAPPAVRPGETGFRAAECAAPLGETVAARPVPAKAPFPLNQPPVFPPAASQPPARPDAPCGGREPLRPVCWDLGAGAGLPGIPLRALWPEGTYHLVELREKRALFLQTVLARLKLERTRVCRMDAAAFMRREWERGRPADLILSRAFMPWPELLDYVRPYLPASGALLLMLNGADFELNRPDWKLLGRQSYSSPGGPRQFAALAPLLS